MDEAGCRKTEPRTPHAISSRGAIKLHPTCSYKLRANPPSLGPRAPLHAAHMKLKSPALRNALCPNRRSHARGHPRQRKSPRAHNCPPLLQPLLQPRGRVSCPAMHVSQCSKARTSLAGPCSMPRSHGVLLASLVHASRSRGVRLNI
jgi:hypothetical protein